MDDNIYYDNNNNNIKELNEINNLSVLYKDFKCNKGHLLNWTGGNNLQERSNCRKCEKLEENNSMRWECVKCKEFFCQFCFPLIKDNKCPISHNYEIKKIGFTNNYNCELVCDICYSSSIQKQDIFFDPICNIYFCNICVSKKEDLIINHRED